MRRFARDELVAFLKQVDAELDEPATLEVIGGAAAVLGYGATRATRDIDTFSTVPPGVQRAARRARAATGLDIPIEKAAVADPPYNYEDRRRKLRVRFERLTILVPERHDLVLMKTVRAERHDLDVIEEMHRVKAFDFDVLVSRFDGEMSQAIIDPRIHRIQFQLVIERLFGKAAARSLGGSTEDRRRS